MASSALYIFNPSRNTIPITSLINQLKLEVVNSYFMANNIYRWKVVHLNIAKISNEMIFPAITLFRMSVIHSYIHYNIMPLCGKLQCKNMVMIVDVMDSNKW